MSLLAPTATTPEIDHAALAAKSLLAHPAAEMRRRIDNHAMLYHMFWDNPLATPAQIAAAMGTRGKDFLAFAGTNVLQFDALVTADNAGKPEDEKLKLSDLIPNSDWMPRLPLTPNPDGTVTVGTIEGLDAWGRPLPVETPAPEESPIEP